MRKFLPHVEKVIKDAKRKKKTTIDQINYIFDTLGGMSIKPAEELTIKELVAWADAFGLDTPKVVLTDKPRIRRTQTI